MTLLIGTFSDSGVVLSADGMSFQTLDRPNKPLMLPGRTTLQKIFLFEDRLSVAHHGKNQIGDDSVEAVIAMCWQSLGIPSNIKEAALQLGQHMTGLGKANLDGGFWVVGRSCGEPQVEGFRVLLPSGHVERLDETFFMDGDGKRFVSRDPECLDHLRIRQLAEEVQDSQGRVLFGGHTHQVTITEDECRWDTRSKSGTLGCEYLLPPLPSPVSKLEGVDSQKDFVVFEMNRLKQEHFRRVRIARGSKLQGYPKTFKGFEEHRPKSRPDWKPDARFYQLIAIGNEAEIAAESDVSEKDALLFTAHVEDVVGTLPPPC